jgi:hypothetical protein
MAAWLPEWVDAKTSIQNRGFYDLMRRRRSSSESCERRLIGKLSIRAFFWAVVRSNPWRISTTASNLSSHDFGCKAMREVCERQERKKRFQIPG